MKNLSKKDKHFLNIAFQTAKNSDLRIKHGAVMVTNGNVVGVGINKRRNHPDVLGPFVQNRASYHAEIVAGSRVSPDKRRGATIYVARVMRDGSTGLSKPCKNCQKTLDRWGVKRVVYTDYGN